MKLSIQQLDREIENSKTDTQGMRFISTMRPFRDLAQREWQRLSLDFTELQDCFIETSDYFCFNPHKYTMEDMFQDISTFLSQLNTACEENRKEVEATARLERAKLIRHNTFNTKANHKQMGYRTF